MSRRLLVDSRSTALTMALMGLAAMDNPGPPIAAMFQHKPKPPQPITDARIAAAEAKRQRKNARRAAQARAAQPIPPPNEE